MASSQNCTVCEACNAIIKPASALAAHMASSEHVERVQGNFVWCSICSKAMVRGNWNGHINGQAHRTEAGHQGIRPNLPPQIPASVEGFKKCKVCNLFVQHGHVQSHERGVAHITQVAARQRVGELKASLKRAAADKGNVTVSHPDGMDMGVLDRDPSGVVKRTHLIIGTPRDDIQLIHAKVRAPNSSGYSAIFTIDHQGSSKLILPNTNLHLVVQFYVASPHVGRYSGSIELLFENTLWGTRFIITRPVTAVIADSADHEAIAPSAPYQPRPRPGQRLRIREIVWGDREKFPRNPYTVRIEPYLIPKALTQALERGSQDVGDTLKRLPAEFKFAHLNASNYAKAMSVQLWMEEHKAVLDMHVFDMFDQSLIKRGSDYNLRVPGLAENRPSIVLGDGVLVQRSQDPNSKWFEGVVQAVRNEELVLRFALSFSPPPNSSFSIRFQFNRYPLRRQHQALHCSFNEERVLFPVKSHVRNGRPPPNLHTRMKNPLIASNPAQLLAVQTIIALPPGAHPFVVFGPPGTGKTVTIVEAIVQLYNSNPNIRILACAPSNSAADLIAVRLLQYVNQENLYRFYSPSRTSALTPDALLPCTTRADDGRSFVVPAKDRVTRPSTRIVVATCVGGAFAYNIGVPQGHFDWVFVDEAGQGSEPEAMVPIKGMAGPRTNVVLSGDPKQLRPVIRSAIAAEVGLGKSFLERLMERVVYDEKEWYGRSLVKLVQNFRSHPSILEFPNKTFYGGDLEAHGDRRITHVFEEWKHHPRPKRKFPVIFHAIAGQDEREASSPSYFNRLEAMQVKSYVKMLLAGGLPAKDIGIITPYHAQAMKIRQIIAPLQPTTQNDDKTRVASVELFQGQERQVIIMSTVRSTEDLIGHDLKHTLGFVGNPRRFNVAMTRAQALLIVVGDPAVLGMDPLWRSWLNWVFLGGGWTGSRGPSWDPEAEVRTSGSYELEVQELCLEQMQQLTDQMRALAVDGDSADGAMDARAWEVDARDAE